MTLLTYCYASVLTVCEYISNLETTLFSFLLERPSLDKIKAFPLTTCPLGG